MPTPYINHTKLDENAKFGMNMFTFGYVLYSHPYMVSSVQELWLVLLSRND